MLTPKTATASATFVLAGKDPDGAWKAIETATCEEGEDAEDIQIFLETMAHANTRNYLEMEILTAAEFAQRCGPPRKIAA